MTSGLALLAHWSVRQKLNRISSVQFSYDAVCEPEHSGLWMFIVRVFDDGRGLPGAEAATEQFPRGSSQAESYSGGAACFSRAK